jgi:hypothetical protein
MPSAPLTVADPLDLPGLACTARTAATRTSGRRPDEVPAARRFIREELNGHPAAFDAELLRVVRARFLNEARAGRA